jgi:hypothetical protein
MTATTKIICVLLLIGFAFMEFPGVLFFQKVSDPFIFGFPFIYGYIICWWIFMVAVLFVAYRLNWGVKRREKS